MTGHNMHCISIIHWSSQIHSLSTQWHWRFSA